MDGTLVIKIGDVKETPKKSDISYTAQPEEETKFDPEDFNNFYQKEYSGDVLYIRFTGSDDLKTSTGKLYYRYDSRNEQSFTATDLKDYYFYYNEDDLPEDDDRCFPLEDLSFVAAKGFSGTVTLDFTAYRSSSKKVTGTLSITTEKSGTTTVAVSSVRYYTTSGTAVQISGNDIARAYAKQYPGSTLQSVELLSVPAVGGLYYDYYSSGRTQLASTSGTVQAFYVNPTGRFVIGGPQGDSGLTGRKIIVDTYGGSAPHGGGAFSGKDPTKVDRSAAYAARYVAKNVVAAGLATRCQVELAYAIGVAAPVSVLVETFGTGTVSDGVLSDAVQQVFDLRPSAIIRDLDLRRPIYRQLAAYGHMGREELGVTWEKTDRVDALLAAVKALA